MLSPTNRWLNFPRSNERAATENQIEPNDIANLRSDLILRCHLQWTRRRKRENYRTRKKESERTSSCVFALPLPQIACEKVTIWLRHCIRRSLKPMENGCFRCSNGSLTPRRPQVSANGRLNEARATRMCQNKGETVTRAKTTLNSLSPLSHHVCQAPFGHGNETTTTTTSKPKRLRRSITTAKRMPHECHGPANLQQSRPNHWKVLEISKFVWRRRAHTSPRAQTRNCYAIGKQMRLRRPKRTKS